MRRHCTCIKKNGYLQKYPASLILKANFELQYDLSGKKEVT